MRTGRTWVAAGLAAMITLAGAGTATADEVVNNLDGTVDAAAETMPLNVGTGGSTQLRIVPGGGDGKPGCNLTGSTTLKVSVASSAPGVAAASLGSAPGADTFTSCSDTKTVTVSPLAVGTATITVRQVANSTDGSFDFAPATFTVTVSQPAPANTAPTVAVTGVEHGATYEVGTVPAAGCAAADSEDGPSSPSPSFSGALDADGLGSRTATCSYTDAGGLTVTESATYSVVDSSAPEVSYVLTPATPDGDNGWWRSEVTLDWTVTESGSPSSLVLDGCDDVVVSADRLAVDHTCSATSSGGSAGPVTVTLKRDGTAPTVSSGAVTGTAGDNGWYTSAVQVPFGASDTTSGVAGPDSATVTTAEQGSAVYVDSPAFADEAGNVAAAGTLRTGPYKIDTVAPAVALAGGPADGSSSYFGSVPAAPTCEASDGTSGLASCTVTGHGTTVGDHTVTATAVDHAGNRSSVSREYTVLAWTAGGFYAPVDMGGVLNTVKAGSTVPLKFELFAGATELTDVAAVSSFTTAKVSCTTGTSTDEIEVTTTGGTSLRYDSTGGQFVQNWKIPTGGGICYRATMTAQDGSKVIAHFKTR